MKYIIISLIAIFSAMGCLTDRGDGRTKNEPDASSQTDTGKENTPDMGIGDDDMRASDTSDDVEKDVKVEDKTPPTVGSFLPANQSENIEFDTEISAMFSEAMDATTLTTDSVHLEDALGKVEATVHYDAESHKVVISPGRPLALWREYTITLDNTLSDEAGNPLEPTTWTFRTRDGKWSKVTSLEKSSEHAQSPTIAPIGNEDFVAAFAQTIQ